ncbi:MAG: hypothetical protein A2359_02220 [Candidatus Moranbacteria bacterium RIFOXYB1_FULL_43_19]|nr:MAG: hypothetical protein A2184_04470 [Candidatus Moranbacteria bacterium RIFOXYA1_FULL_44_7]OGI27998.1 MAG: hypothetical protein A2359_02220 [Candidatus Moranbacteria bacterium RIFOXYB1_FULL_43_19]OGI33544.1 MAG: hypothetical protein A2420_00265 [Candidatus Moranbacteria bacterium RIFOXYC1_FULL_44_13]OGI37519.1 MAG: hypothetical protein A2612_05270 [Candidatus Moranbacteria bacterium RIFOXYD1_FULL_44_12]
MEQKSELAGQTKKCPQCGEEILASAKKCKHCQADLRNWFVKHKIATAILALLVLIVIISAGGKNEEENKNIPASSNAESKSTAPSKKTVPLVNDPTIKQIGSIPADYIGQSFVLKVNAKTADYYNYGFDDETKYYALEIWDDSVDGDLDSIYAYVDKNDTNKQLVNQLLDSSVQLEINASIPKAKYESGSNAFMKIDSWKTLGN